MISRMTVTALAASLSLGGAALMSGAEAKGFAGGGFVGGGGRLGVVGGVRAYGHAGRPGFLHGHGRWGYGHGRFGSGNRFGYERYGYGGGRVGSYGYGGLPIYGSYGFGNAGYPVVAPPYDSRSGQPTVGIAPAPVLPPAIYVIGGDRRSVTVRKVPRAGARADKGGRVAVSYGGATSQIRAQ